MASTRLTVRLEGELRRRIERIARQQAVRPSDVVREALEAFCRGRETDLTCYDIARKAGVIGVAKGLPPDLSTNPKYLEGFGKS